MNGFGWFLDRPADLPPLPGLNDLDWPAHRIDLEREMRFPWSGGRHPWLDAAIETGEHLIGIESKRFEPFRDKHMASFSAAYDADVWSGLEPFAAMRDRLRTQPKSFRHLDAAQLVKHALGLAAEGRRIGKARRVRSKRGCRAPSRDRGFRPRRRKRGRPLRLMPLARLAG